MLQVKFDAEAYNEHLEKWARWKAGQAGGRAVAIVGPVSCTLSSLVGVSQGGSTNALREAQYTATGTETKREAPARDYMREGYDTEKAIDLAVDSLQHARPITAEVLITHFTKPGSVESKAAQVNLSYSQYRAKLDDARRYIIACIAGIKIGQRGKL